MYYLIKKNLDGMIRIIGNCEKSSHRAVILNNYCVSNDIKLVNCRKDINDECRGEGQLYTYPIEDNRCVILDCTYHDKNLIFNSYVEKVPYGIFEIHYFNVSKLPLVDLSLTKNDYHDKNLYG